MPRNRARERQPEENRRVTPLDLARDATRFFPSPLFILTFHLRAQRVPWKECVMEPVVRVYRGDEVESIHYGSVAVVSATGKLLASLGDPGFKTFVRSAAKPFQCIPLLEEGGRDEYDLTDEQIALICASHGGELRHISEVTALLRKGEFDETDLLCGAHYPFDERSAAELRQAGERPSPLHNNCSGKHAGMLLASLLIDAPTTTYLEPDHPLQQRILTTFARFCDLDPDEIPIAVDGCGVPTFYASLYRAAYGYARLAATSLGPAAAGALGDYASSARDVVTSMTANPFFVAGSHSITTPLMEEFDGRVLAKEGAEAFYAMAIFPSADPDDHDPLFADGPIGVAIKIADGSIGRARDPVIVSVLEELGLPAFEKPSLRRYVTQPVQNVAGRQVGQVRSELTLRFT